MKLTPRRVIIGAVGVVAGVGIAVGGSLAASGGSSSSTPPSALSVVQADGYTTGAAQLPAAQLTQDSGNVPAGTFTSGAAGFNSSGNGEVVIVLSSNGETLINAAGGQLALQAGVPSGVTVSINGDIIRMDGSEAALGQLS